MAAACASAVGMTPAFQSGIRALMAEISLIAGEGCIMGGTGNPIPDGDYIASVEHLYLPSGYDYQVLTTPEQFCPIICNPAQPDLNFGDSVTAGVTQLDTNVSPELANGPVSVLGYSQSATVATVWMNQLIDSNNPHLDNLHVTLLGDPNNAVSGILDRFQFSDGVGQFSVDPDRNTYRFSVSRWGWTRRRPPASTPMSTSVSTTAGQLPVGSQQPVRRPQRPDRHRDGPSVLPGPGSDREPEHRRHHQPRDFR